MPTEITLSTQRQFRQWNRHQFLIKEIQFIGLEEEVSPYELYICSFSCPFVNRFPAATDFPWQRQTRSRSELFSTCLFVCVCLDLLLPQHLPVPQVAASWPIKHLSPVRPSVRLVVSSFCISARVNMNEVQIRQQIACFIFVSLSLPLSFPLSLLLFSFDAGSLRSGLHLKAQTASAVPKMLLCHLHDSSSFFFGYAKGSSNASPSPLSTRNCAKNEPHNLFWL